MDESRAHKSCHIHCKPCKTLAQKSTAHLILNVQGLANVGTKVNNTLRKNNRKKKISGRTKLQRLSIRKL